VNRSRCSGMKYTDLVKLAQQVAEVKLKKEHQELQARLKRRYTPLVVSVRGSVVVREEKKWHGKENNA